ncbi:Mitochondrial import inner membrane translocase subunit Tim21 [Aphelenchoides besseyi]|nr:Mitochondrial import inner membrane translocase subunit Tim21 [Aphelenchoides besseyi]
MLIHGSNGKRTLMLKCALRIRYLSSNVQKTGLSVCTQLIAVQPLTVSGHRFYVTEKPVKSEFGESDTTKPDIQRPRSILEEVLIKEEQEPKTTAQKVKKKAENTFFYISLGVAMCTLGGLTYLLFEYFFATSSPQRIYTKALKMIREDPQCQNALGESIAGFGEQGRRARRHIASQSYRKDDEERVRVTFHVKGTRNAGRAFVEIAKKPGESYQCRFLLVELADRSGSLVIMAGETHKEIMEQDGYVVVRKSRRSFFGGPKRRWSMAEKQCTDGDPQVSVECVRKAVKDANENLDQFLKEYLLKFLDALTHAVGSGRHVRTLRAVGIGNFFEMGSDSALQLAVLQRIQLHFDYPSTFYQEPRCAKAEKLFLESIGITVLPSDSLHSLPKPIQLLTRPNAMDVHLVFMIHFDQFGFERMMSSFARFELLDSLVFVGNTVPIDHSNDQLNGRLEQFESVPVELPDRRVSSHRELRDRCASWWRKAFQNTRIYFDKQSLCLSE